MTNGAPQSAVPGQRPQRTILAHMKVRSFISPPSPNEKQLKEYDKKLSTFLKTVDNTNRMLNGRNSYAVGDRVYTLVWILDRIADKPVTTPFGKGVKPGQPIITDDKDNSPKKETNK